MKDTNTSSKFPQPIGGYIPGTLPEEEAALKRLATAKAEFERRHAKYDELASKHKFFSDSAAESVDESRAINEKIRNALREQTGLNSNKDVITLRAEMREALEMIENYLFLADECNGSLTDAKIAGEKAAEQYRAANAVAMELIADNMLSASIDSIETLYLAMHAKVITYQERLPGEKTWAHHGFDSEESAVISDVVSMITRFYRSLDEFYLRQMLPPQFSAPIDLGDLRAGSPASWRKARTVSETKSGPSAS